MGGEKDLDNDATVQLSPEEIKEILAKNKTDSETPDDAGDADGDG